MSWCKKFQGNQGDALKKLLWEFFYIFAGQVPSVICKFSPFIISLTPRQFHWFWHRVNNWKHSSVEKYSKLHFHSWRYEEGKKKKKKMVLGSETWRTSGRAVTAADSLAMVVHHLPFVGSWACLSWNANVQNDTFISRLKPWYFQASCASVICFVPQMCCHQCQGKEIKLLPCFLMEPFTAASTSPPKPVTTAPAK